MYSVFISLSSTELLTFFKFLSFHVGFVRALPYAQGNSDIRASVFYFLNEAVTLQNSVFYDG